MVGVEMVMEKASCYLLSRRRWRARIGCGRCSCCGGDLFPSDVHRESNQRGSVGSSATLFHWRGCTEIPPLKRRLSISFFRRGWDPFWIDVLLVSSSSSCFHCCCDHHFFSSLMEIPSPFRPTAPPLQQTTNSAITQVHSSWYVRFNCQVRTNKIFRSHVQMS